MENLGIHTLMLSIGSVFIAFVIIAGLFRIIAKVVFKTFYEEKEKFNDKLNGGRKKRKIKK